LLEKIVGIKVPVTNADEALEIRGPEKGVFDSAEGYAYGIKVGVEWGALLKYAIKG
jgi:hypothetical protein